MEEVLVRAFDPERDRSGTEAVDRMCEVGPSGTMSLYTDLLGDPVCRVRHSPAFRMLVHKHSSSSSSLLPPIFQFFFFKFYLAEVIMIMIMTMMFTICKQVAETITRAEKEIVGLIRGCIKTVTCGKKNQRLAKNQTTIAPIYTKVAYILGLRVSPSHR